MKRRLTKILMMDEGYAPVDRYPWWQLYGQQSDERDFHKNGFTVKRMQTLLESLDIFEDIEVVNGDNDVNVYAKARKIRHLEPHALLPQWDAIGEAEGIKLPGVEPIEPEKPVRKVRAKSNGVKPEEAVSV